MFLKRLNLKCLLEVVSVVQCFEKQFYIDSCLLINYQLKHSPSCNTSSSNFAFSLAYSIVYVKPLQPLVLTPIFKPIWNTGKIHMGFNICILFDDKYWKQELQKKSLYWYVVKGSITFCYSLSHLKINSLYMVFCQFT